MAYALIIEDENGYEVVNHVSNYSDDTVYVDDAYINDVGGFTEWNKAGKLINWVKKHKPNWKIYEQYFEILPIAGGSISFENK